MNAFERSIAISLGAVAVSFLAWRAITIWQAASHSGKNLAYASGRKRVRDPVDEASEDSFPASDPPARTPVSGVGPRL